MRAACSLRRHGRQRERQVRCARSFCEYARRGQHVAAVATARTLAVIIRHLLRKGESYAWARPVLQARKLRDLQLKAGYKAERGQKGAAHAFNIKSYRDQERRWVEQAGAAYTRFVACWIPAGRNGRARAPQMRRDDEGCAAGLSPHALLFAARSPMRGTKIAQIWQKATCRSDAATPIVGGLMVGFGTRLANGCTSGCRRARLRRPRPSWPRGF
jgi:hypothetical protein